MRVKTVPRHLPERNSSTQGFTRGKDADTSEKFVSTKKLEDEGSLRVKILNFTTYEDIVEEMNFAKKQDKMKTETTFNVQCKPRPSDIKARSPNFSTKEETNAGSSEQKEKFKDSYLYQIMTDPSFIESIKRDKRLSQNCCPYCKKEFDNQLELKKHLVSTLTNDSNRLTCCACGKTFARKRYLRYHQRSHSEPHKYTCNICTRKYSRHDNLTRHNIFHTNPDKFPCNSCERTFARKDLLNKHLKCHENKYKFHCGICQKYFKGPVTLQNHVKLFHSDSKTTS